MSTIARVEFEASDGGLLKRFSDNCSSQITQSFPGAERFRRDSVRQEGCFERDVRQRFVYTLKNNEDPPRYYTGHTSDVARRLAEHNAGNCIHTAKYRPWSVDVVIEFPDETRAVAFERYLESGSGVAFAQRHLR
jgi:predicted GIY-YIG superfamily endonuclease